MVTATRPPDLAYEIDPKIQDELLTYSPGLWVALTPHRIIATAGTATEAYQAARSAGVDDPIIYEIPSRESGAYYF